MQMWKKTFCYIELNVASIKCLRKSSSSLDPIEHTRIHSYLNTDLFCPHVYIANLSQSDISLSICSCMMIVW